MTEYHGQLIVTTTAHNHAQLADVIQKLRRATGAQIRVEAVFLTIDPEAAARFMSRDGKPTPFLNDEQLHELMEEHRASQHATRLTAPRVTLWSGQEATIAVSTDRSYVQSLKVVRPTTGPSRVEPQLDTASSGIWLTVRAAADLDNNRVLLTLCPRIATLVGLRSEPDLNTADDSTRSVQRPDLKATELATTLAVPDGQTVVLAGPIIATTLERARRPGAPTTAPATQLVPQQLLFLVKPTVIGTHEANTARDPLRKPASAPGG
jgi:type II secretory pathway component GspD/PulD (secretin)